jgi:hypothetical protein
MSPERISDHVAFDPALAIKFTIRHTTPSGSPGDGDIFGSQPYGPLLDLEIPPGEPGGWQPPRRPRGSGFPVSFRSR